jgi:integrase
VDAPRRERRHPGITALPTGTMIEATQVLLAVADRTPYGLIVRTAIMSGLREGEIFSLRWSDLDLASGWVHVRREITKTDSGERDVYLDGDLVARLQIHRTEQIKIHGEPVPVHVFTTARGHAWTQPTFAYHWQKIRAAADLPGLHFHDLRHLQATLMQRAGVHMMVAQARLGHAGATMTGMYTHPNRAEQEAAAEAVARLFPPSA